MKSTQFSISEKKTERFTGDLIVYCLERSSEGSFRCENEKVLSLLAHMAPLGEFSAKTGECLLLYPQTMTEKGEGELSFSAKRLLLVGLGIIDGDQKSDELREICRLTGGTIAQQAARVKAGSLMIHLPEIMGLAANELIESLTEGCVLGDYRFDKYKKKDPENESYQGIDEVCFAVRVNSSTLKKGMLAGQVAALAARGARDMANEPGSSWTPAHFADHGRMLAQKYGMRCAVLEKADMKRLGMGGILAVNQGSVEPPKMVLLEYRPAHTTQTLLVVGKGLTFDSGGVSLKPAAGMEDMKYDMCGGAAVMALMQAVGEERPDLGIVAIVPATDNMGGGAAVKPGDIITHYNGLTSEIVNTDAEGRMILADALAYGIEKFTPDCVIDLATLTGAVIVGLGHHRTGLLATDDDLAARLLAAGERSGEPLWRLPLGPEYSKQIESQVADMKNSGGKSAGTITAAAYLQKFVGDTPWAHLDIAGTAWEFTEKSYIPKGPSGVGVRTLLELVRGWKKEAMKRDPRPTATSQLQSGEKKK